MSRHKLLIAALVALVSLGGFAALYNGDHPGDEAAVAPAPGGAGLIGVTGDPNDPDAAKSAVSPGLNTSSEGLTEEPSTGSAGGVKVDLNGRFQQAVTASVGDSDSVVVECVPDTGHGGGR